MANQGSALLRCLAQLDVDTWASVLLPKLVDDGSAADFALTCTQLRELCHSSVKQLDLQTLTSPDNPYLIELWTQDLGQRFPACSKVDLLVEDNDSFTEGPLVLKALARWVSLPWWVSHT